MNQIAISRFKVLSAKKIKSLMPLEITSDGLVIGRFVDNFEKHATDSTGNSPDIPVSTAQVATPKPKLRMKCPNCKLVNDFEVDDGEPYFFSMKHP